MSIFIARTSAVTLTASTTLSLVQVVASTKPLRIKEIGISFNGTDSTKEPIQLDILRQTSAGTSSSLTLVENQEIGETALATALQTFSAEPSAGDILRSWYISPAGTTWAFQWPMGDEIIVGPSGRLGIRAITASGVTPKVLPYIVFDE